MAEAILERLAVAASRRGEGGGLAGHRSGDTDAQRRDFFVTLTFAQSLDGSIASRERKPLALSSKESWIVTHRLRAMHDAIVVGVGTVIADNPSLTTRLVEGPSPRPVVLDSHLRTPVSSALIKARGADAEGAIIACSSEMDDAMRARKALLENAGAVVCPYDLAAGLDGALALVHSKHKLNRFMIEGGARVITSALCCKGLVDRVLLTLAPLVAGGLAAIDQNSSSHFNFVKLKFESVATCGTDLFLECSIDE